MIDLVVKVLNICTDCT